MQQKKTLNIPNVPLYLKLGLDEHCTFKFFVQFLRIKERNIFDI